jgi:hypothetical protein
MDERGLPCSEPRFAIHVGRFWRCVFRLERELKIARSPTPPMARTQNNTLTLDARAIIAHYLRRETIAAVAEFVHPLGYSAMGQTASPTRRDNAIVTDGLRDPRRCAASGSLTYIITTRRITFGELLKYRERVADGLKLPQPNTARKYALLARHRRKSATSGVRGRCEIGLRDLALLTVPTWK